MRYLRILVLSEQILHSTTVLALDPSQLCRPLKLFFHFRASAGWMSEHGPGAAGPGAAWPAQRGLPGRGAWAIMILMIDSGEYK